jgi:hypothetical protein
MHPLQQSLLFPPRHADFPQRQFLELLTLSTPSIALKLYIKLGTDLKYSQDRCQPSQIRHKIQGFKTLGYRCF